MKAPAAASGFGQTRCIDCKLAKSRSSRASKREFDTMASLPPRVHSRVYPLPDAVLSAATTRTGSSDCHFLRFSLSFRALALSSCPAFIFGSRDGTVRARSPSKRAFTASAPLPPAGKHLRDAACLRCGAAPDSLDLSLDIFSSGLRLDRGRDLAGGTGGSLDAGVLGFRTG